jgi:hypothetical protein
LGRRAIEQHGANVTVTVKTAVQDRQAKRAEAAMED